MCSYLLEVEIIGADREVRPEICQRQPHVVVAFAANGQRLRHGAHAARQQPRREFAVKRNFHLRSITEKPTLHNGDLLLSPFISSATRRSVCSQAVEVVAQEVDAIRIWHDRCWVIATCQHAIFTDALH